MLYYALYTHMSMHTIFPPPPIPCVAAAEDERDRSGFQHQQQQSLGQCWMVLYVATAPLCTPTMLLLLTLAHVLAGPTATRCTFYLHRWMARHLRKDFCEMPSAGCIQPMSIPTLGLGLVCSRRGANNLNSLDLVYRCLVPVLLLPFAQAQISDAAASIGVGGDGIFEINDRGQVYTIISVAACYCYCYSSYCCQWTRFCAWLCNLINCFSFCFPSYSFCFWLRAV